MSTITDEIDKQLNELEPDFTEANRNMSAIAGSQFKKLPDGVYEGYIHELVGTTVTGNTPNKGKLKFKWTLAAEKIIKCTDKEIKNITDLEIRGLHEHIHRVLRPAQLATPDSNSPEAREIWLFTKEKYDKQTLEMLAMSGLYIQNQTIRDMWNDVNKARGNRVRWTIKTDKGQRYIYLEASLEEEKEDENTLPFSFEKGAPDGKDAPIGVLN